MDSDSKKLEESANADFEPKKPPPPKLHKRIIMNTIIIVIGFGMLFTGCVFFAQRKMIYFPRRYPSSYKVGLPPGTKEISFITPSSGLQTCFYIPPQQSSDTPNKPARIWIVFGGNGATALSWLDFVEAYPRDDTSFLLVDYPGYGLCEGKPTRETIVEAALAVREAMPGTLAMTPEEFDALANLLAHSIGGAVALEYAVRHPADQIVLISPFTSMLDMARRSVGIPLAWLLKDRFDNRALLDEIAAGESPPPVTIIHGTADDIVPFSMGRELADRHPDIIEFIPIQGADHNWIIDSARSQIIKAMNPEQTSDDPIDTDPKNE